jgi:deoxyribodipyrimidine photo-lyase
MRTLHWFRVDLRTTDNTALHHAASHSSRGVVGLFVLDPSNWQRHDWAPVKVDFILRTLAQLRTDLAKLNIPLLIRNAAHHRDIPATVLRAAKDAHANAVTWNIEYEVHETQRDERTRETLLGAGLKVSTHHDVCVLPPGDVRTQSGGGPYTVYSPFKRQWISELESRGGIGAGIPLLPAPKRQHAIDPAENLASDPIPASIPGFASTVPADLWPAGEHAAMARLQDFCARQALGYKELRDFPAREATSRLSPYLAIGAISPRQCVARAQEANGGKLVSKADGPTHWISEVIWREFYKHILVAFPRVCKGRAFKPATEAIVWSDRDDHFDAWCQGRTGVPIVDAAMRALPATGWMHNRLRMIVAMYLTKDLFIDWRRGERWFMRHLIDGDLSQNNGGWQWSASTGTDAAPYFRVFNPVLQSEKFDPDGRFIKRWMPELAGVPAEFIHDPHSAPLTISARLNYPAPIIDRATVKDRVMAAFRAVGEAASDAR